MGKNNEKWAQAVVKKTASGRSVQRNGKGGFVETESIIERQIKPSERVRVLLCPNGQSTFLFRGKSHRCQSSLAIIIWQGDLFAFPRVNIKKNE